MIGLILAIVGCSNLLLIEVHECVLENSLGVMGAAPKVHSRFARIVRIAALFAWMLGIFLLSNEPSNESELRSGFFTSLLQGIGVDWQTEFLSTLIRKGAHAFAYFVLGVLAFLVAETTRLPRKGQALASLLLVFAYAVSDEIHQVFVPGRSGEVGDVILDTVAGALGITVVFLLRRRRSRDPAS